MTWFGWVFIVLMELDVAGRVMLIGQTREYTAKKAWLDVLTNLILIIGVLAIGTGKGLG